MRGYQTHDPAMPGYSDSFRKLERLSLPSDLTGTSVLDIGCNEGFFCNVAAQRGASRVVGLDFVEPFLGAGRQRYPHSAIEWLHSDWKYLPEGPFGLVLWCSAMHYEDDPAAMIARIARILTPGGLFVLECGVANLGGCEMTLVARHGDNRWYPTHDYLYQTLRRHFDFERVAMGEEIEGDPIPREVYHCRPRLPKVLVLREGRPHDTATLSSLVSGQVTKVIGIPPFLDRLRSAPFAHHPVVGFLKTLPGEFDTPAMLAALDGAGLAGAFARLLGDAVAGSDALVVMHGPLTPPQMDALAAVLEGRARLFNGAHPHRRGRS